MTPKIIELVIEDDDNQAGLDGIALVEHPAHEALFEYFAEAETPCESGTCNHYVLSDAEIPKVIQMFNAYGEPQGLLEKEGWVIDSVKSVSKQDFAIISNPNAPSAQDTDQVRFRYKYVGPRDKKNRTFCAEMMAANRVFRIEDLRTMSDESVNPVGPSGYSIIEWRGSYNCRHKFVQLMYKRAGTIIDKASVRKGLLDEDGMPGPDTRTEATIKAGNTPPRTGFAAQGNPDVSALQPYVDEITKPKRKPVLTGDMQITTLPLFEKKEDAEAMAELLGCEGCHEHQYGDKTLYMPCEKHPEGFAEGSYDDYPELIKKNAQAVLDYIEKSGNPQGCMTQVGKVRAQQLAQGKPISIDTVKRMKAYIERHKKDLETSKSYEDGCGKLAMDAWGGVEALSWVESTIKKYESMAGEKVSIDFDDTLSTKRGQELAKRLISEGVDLHVITRRQETASDEVYKIAEQVGIPKAKVHFTNGKLKWETIKRLGVVKHYDNNPDEIKAIEENLPEVKAIKFQVENLLDDEDYDIPDNPSSMYASTAFASQNEASFAVFNNEQRLVVGAAMVPDKMIIRRNEITGEIYYVYCTAETILKLQQKFMKDKLLDKANIEHQRKFLNNVDVVESWIVEDPQKDKQQVFGMNYPKGTWMIIMSLKDNDDAWQKVKDGTLRGYSVQGYFLERAKFSTNNNEVLDEIKNILKEVK